MRIRAILLFIAALALTACGKRGALIYPDMLVPAQPAAVSARQAGQAIRLSFTLPRKDRAGREIQDLSGVKIFRRVTVAGQESGCNACTEDFALFRTLYLEPLSGNGVQRNGSQIQLLDSDVRGGETYSYTVTPFTADGIEGQASPRVTATMVAPPPPPGLTAVPDPIQIELVMAPASVEQGTFVGYNIYRAVQGERLPYVPLNPEPVRGPSYLDGTLDRRLSYLYAARTVVRMADGSLVESELSNQVLTKVTDE